MSYGQPFMFPGWPAGMNPVNMAQYVSVGANGVFHYPNASASATTFGVPMGSNMGQGSGATPGSIGGEASGFHVSSTCVTSPPLQDPARS
jgi:hypothetical protein